MDERKRGRRVGTLTLLVVIALLAVGGVIGARVYRHVGSDAWLIARVRAAPEALVTHDEQGALVFEGAAERLAARCHGALGAVLDAIERTAVDDPARGALLGVAKGIYTRHESLGVYAPCESGEPLPPGARARLYGAALAMRRSRDPRAVGVAVDVLASLEQDAAMISRAIVGRDLTGPEVEGSDHVSGLGFDRESLIDFGAGPLPSEEHVAPHLEALVATEAHLGWAPETISELIRLGPVAVPALVTWCCARVRAQPGLQDWARLEDLVRLDPGLERTLSLLDGEPTALALLVRLAPWLARIGGRQRVLRLLGPRIGEKLHPRWVGDDDPTAGPVVRLAGARHELWRWLPASDGRGPGTLLFAPAPGPAWRAATARLVAWWEQVGPDVPLAPDEGWVLVRVRGIDPAIAWPDSVTARPAVGEEAWPDRPWYGRFDSLEVEGGGDFLLGPLPAGPCVVRIDLFDDPPVELELTVPPGDATVEREVDLSAWTRKHRPESEAPPDPGFAPPDVRGSR